MSRWSDLISEPGIGLTNELAGVCKTLSAVLVCVTEKEARRVRQEFRIPAVSVRGNPDSARGMRAVVFDSSAVAVLLYEMEERHRQELHDLKQRITRVLETP